MKIEIVHGMAEAIRGWVAGSIGRFQPRLCCEADRVSLSVAVDAVCAVVRKWGSGLLLLRGAIDGRQCCLLVDIAELRDVVQQMLCKEGTLSVTDVAQETGCTFDVSENEEEEGIYGLLAAAWGMREESVAQVKQIAGDAEVFRGN